MDKYARLFVLLEAKMASQTRSKKSSRSDTVGQEAMSADATMSCFERLLDKKLSELKADLATKDCIKELKDIITVQKNRIDELESKIVIMEKLIENLREDNDDTQQYQRRLCLRIGGVELTKGSNGESGEECLKIVKKIFKELNVSVPDTVIDRAHRIGKTKEYRGKRYRQIIVRFTTWRHRTAVYRARKKSKKYKIWLDLTKRRLKTQDEANSILEAKEKSDDCFVFADVNCRLCVKLDGEFHNFGNLDELRNLVNDTEGENGDEVVEDDEQAEDDGQAKDDEDTESEEELDDP